MNNRRSCDLCEIDIHRASYSRHLKSEKHIKNEEKNLTERMKTISETMFGPNGVVLKTSIGNDISLDIDRINQLYSKLANGSNHPEYYSIASVSKYKYKNNCMWRNLRS